MIVTQAQIEKAGNGFSDVLALLVDNTSNKEQLTQILLGLIPVVSDIAAMDIPPELRVAVASRMLAVVHKRLNDQLLPLALPPTPVP